MFAIYCPHVNGPVLRSFSAIVSLSNTPHGIELAMRCTCGEVHTMLTGAAAGERHAVSA